MSESVSIVVPAFNEQHTIRPVLTEIVNAMDRFDGGWEIIVVDDASTDQTAPIVTDFSSTNNRVRLITHQNNQGSGGAIRTGLRTSSMTLVIYAPADGQFDPTEIPSYVDAAKNADIVLGIRSSRSDYTLRRKIQSAVYLGLVNTVFRQRYQDVNWVHLWRRVLVSAITPRSRGVFFLQEILCEAKKDNLRIVEIPSTYRPRKGGSAKGGSTKTVLATLFDAGTYLLKGAVK
jgi:glycosyltransferase involved in cell wall biosynthesis